MRYRIKQSDIAINYQSTNTIEVRGLLLNLDEIRLIVDETQKIVLCSSMQKDLVQNIDHDTARTATRITFATSLITLVNTDTITFEVDLGDSLPTDYAKDLTVAKNATVAKEKTLKDVTAPELTLADLYRELLQRNEESINVIEVQYLGDCIRTGRTFTVNSSKVFEWAMVSGTGVLELVYSDDIEPEEVRNTIEVTSETYTYEVYSCSHFSPGGGDATLANQQKMMVNFGMSEGEPQLQALTDTEILNQYDGYEDEGEHIEGIADATYGHLVPAQVTIDDEPFTFYQERTYSDYGYSVLYRNGVAIDTTTTHPQEDDELTTTI